MFKTIDGAADCEIRSVIRFLNARNVLPSEIHHQTCQVYGDNAMSYGMDARCASYTTHTYTLYNRFLRNMICSHNILFTKTN